MFVCECGSVPTCAPFAWHVIALGGMCGHVPGSVRCWCRIVEALGAAEEVV